MNRRTFLTTAASVAAVIPSIPLVTVGNTRLLPVSKHVQELEYLDNRRVPMRAYLTKAHFPSTVITNSGTQDPLWHYFDSQSNEWGREDQEWLTYLGTDGGNWQTRVHAQYNGASHLTKIWIDSRKLGGGGDNHTMQIVDWQNIRWDIRIDGSVQNDVAPGFTLTQV